MRDNRYIDGQGRVLIPRHMLRELGLGPGAAVDLHLADDDTITVKAAKSRCAVCGAETDDCITIGDGKKLCRTCSRKAVEAMEEISHHDNN